jgi:hypothetical protein
MQPGVTSCEICGFVYDDLPVRGVASHLRARPDAYREVLASTGDADARRRPHHDVWSMLEYACHVRDVLLIQRDRALLALVETAPGFPRMYRDERVSLAHYDAHPPAQVADHLAVAAELCATVFDGLTPEQWGRSLVYNYPAPSPRDVAWLGRNTVHEVEHHLADIRGVRARVVKTSRAEGR